MYGDNQVDGILDATSKSCPLELALSGRLDHAAVPGFGAILDAVLERQPSEILIDVSECHYADAAGIALLLDTHRRSRRAGGSLTLRAPSPRLRRLFQIARVDHVLHVEPGQPTPDAEGRPDLSLGAGLYRSRR